MEPLGLGYSTQKALVKGNMHLPVKDLLEATHQILDAKL